MDIKNFLLNQNDYKQPHTGQTIHEQLHESNKRKRDLSTHNTLFKVPLNQ
jgi:hypothetical protein